VKRTLRMAIAALAVAPAAVTAQTLPGSPALDDSLLQPGAWEVSITMKRGEQVMQGGTTRYELNRQPEGRWRLVSTTESQLGVATDTVVMEQGTLRPLTHRSHAVPRKLFLDFDGTRVTGMSTPTDSAGRPIEHTTEVPTFDAASLETIIGALPLAPGYATHLPLFIAEQGGLTWAEVEVAGQTTAADRPAWEVRVKLAGYQVTYYLARDGRLPLGGRVDYPNGAVVEMRRTGGSGR